MTPLKTYRKNMAAAGRAQGKSDADTVKDTHAWWSTTGRGEFIAAFQHETGIQLGVKRSPSALIEHGYPKNVNEYQGKTAWDQYYVANALIAIGELDRLFDAKFPYRSGEQEIFYTNIVGLSQKLLLDTIVLVDDWATFKHETPGIVGIGKTRFERSFALYQSARQIINGNVSAFSFSTNHSDTAINQLRMAIEIRLRQGFGIVAKITNGGAVVPLALSEIIEAIRPHKASITFSCPFEHIERIYGWANIYVHSGFKQYTWSPMYALTYLHVFLAGGNYPGGSGVNAGIIVASGVIKQVQSAVESAIDKRKHKLLVDDPQVCDAIIPKRKRT